VGRVGRVGRIKKSRAEGVYVVTPSDLLDLLDILDLPDLPDHSNLPALYHPRARTGCGDEGFHCAAGRRAVAARDVAHEIGQA
jgi:hypothetical protein